MFYDFSAAQNPCETAEKEGLVVHYQAPCGSDYQLALCQCQTGWKGSMSHAVFPVGFGKIKRRAIADKKPKRQTKQYQQSHTAGWGCPDAHQENAHTPAANPQSFLQQYP